LQLLTSNIVFSFMNVKPIAIACATRGFAGVSWGIRISPKAHHETPLMYGIV